jgi:hypothetical protein
MLYLRREYSLLLQHTSDLQGLVFTPNEVSGDEKWSGILFVRSDASPWYRGAFSFTVTFPPKYPFECPTADFDAPLESHPLLLEGGRRVPFDHEYMMCDPMRVSIMLVLLRYIRRLFASSDVVQTNFDDNGSPVRSTTMIDRRKSQVDVERRSITQEVMLATPYVAFLTNETKNWIVSEFLQHDERVRSGATADDLTKAAAPTNGQRFACWLMTSCLPRIAQFQ